MPPAWKYDRTYDLSSMEVHLYDKDISDTEDVPESEENENSVHDNEESA